MNNLVVGVQKGQNLWTYYLHVTPNFTSIQDDGDNQGIKKLFKKIARIA
jgi:hypothetical protein